MIAIFLLGVCSGIIFSILLIAILAKIQENKDEKEWERGNEIRCIVQEEFGKMEYRKMMREKDLKEIERLNKEKKGKK